MTSWPALRQRLGAGEIIILDGAIGTELERRGAPMDSVAWCAVATKSHPDLLKQIHIDYIDAGADIITANTFSAARHVLHSAGLGDETEAINRAAVTLARRAVEEAGREGVLVAGSISSMGPLDGPWSSLGGDVVAASYREQAELLAYAGTDVLIAEMMIDPSNASLVIEAAKDTGLPLLVGWSASWDDEGGVVPYRGDRHHEGEGLSFDELMSFAAELGGDVAGIMHSDVDVTLPALQVLANHWDGPLMAYAETGHFQPPNWVFSDVVSPSRYAELAGQWVASGVRIVGGCCGTTPEHIAALKSSLVNSSH